MNHYWTSWVLPLCTLALSFRCIHGQETEEIGTGPTALPCPSSPYPQCTMPDGSYGSCKPLTMCAHYYSTKLRFQDCNDPYPKCSFGCNSTGVCCPNVCYDAKRPEPLNETVGDFMWENPPIDDALVIYCIERATAEMREFQQDAVYERDEGHVSNFHTGIYPTEYMSNHRDLYDCGYLIMRVAVCLQEYTNNTYNPLALDQAIPLSDPKYKGYLPYECAYCSTFGVPCTKEEQLARPFSGACNNINNREFGHAGTPAKRFLVPNYGDNAWSPDAQYESYDARQTRTCLMPEKKVYDCGVSQIFTYMGQLIVHDVVSSAFYQGSTTGRSLDCCYNYDQPGMTKKCMGMNTKGDRFYEGVNVTCISLARVALSAHKDCVATYAAQTSTVSHYLDLSPIYGSNDYENAKLREFVGGRLKMEGVGCDQMLPKADDAYAGCAEKAKGYCFQCGDGRCNENLGLLILHTLWARLHNYIARQIACVNSHFTDKQIFELARKIAIAMYQHIIYNDYLPRLMGYNMTAHYGVMPTSCGYNRDYDIKETATTRAAWAVAANRLHTSVDSKVPMRDGCYQIQYVENLANTYFDPRLVHKSGNLDMLLRGLLASCQAKIDEKFDCGVSSCAVRDKTRYGIDMAAVNIKRNADYGLPSWNAYRKLCELEEMSTWEDLNTIMDPWKVACLQATFGEVENIPLYIGGLMENKPCGSMLGETFTHINAQMFKYWRDADWHFYTNPFSGLFTPGQLEEIRKTSMAWFLCQVACIKCTPTFPFLVPGHKNPMVCCAEKSKIPRIDWTQWQEAPPVKTEL